MNRGQFSDLTLEDALPVLEEIITDSMEEFPMEHETIFNVRTMDRGIIQHTQVTGIPAIGQVTEGAEYPLDAMVQGYDKTYRAYKYGVMLAITEELLEDNQHDEVFERAEHLGRAMREAERISAAGVFNNAFTAGATAGPDGLALCSTAHTLPYPGAGTSSNRLATDADLSFASLEDMVTLMRKTKDGAGKKVLLRPKHLIVPPELEFLAHELLESESKPQASTANNKTEVNATNAVRARYGLEPVVMDYLTDDDAWFLAAGKGSHKVFWFWRKQPVTSSDMEFKSDVALMKIKARWALGFSDWRGICGTTGA
jgi:hypothetical protein